MISHDRKFIFVHVGRTGGSSFERAAGVSITLDARTQHLGNTDFIEKHKPFDYYKKSYPSEFNSYFKFTIVRNPFERLVSRWLWRSEVIKDNKLSLYDFINTRPKNSKYSEFFKLTGLSIDDSIKMFDYIGRFEQLQDTFAYLCEKFNINIKDVHHTNMTQTFRYQDYFDNDSIELVNRLYKDDLRIFCYKF